MHTYSQDDTQSTDTQSKSHTAIDDTQSSNKRLTRSLLTTFTPV